MTTLGFDLFIAHIKTLKDSLQEFHTQHKDLPNTGFDEEYKDSLRSGLKRIDYVIELLQSFDRPKFRGLEEWFEFENQYLASYHDEPVDNYIHALMNMQVVFRSTSDLYHKIT